MIKQSTIHKLAESIFKAPSEEELIRRMPTFEDIAEFGHNQKVDNLRDNGAHNLKRILKEEKIEIVSVLWFRILNPITQKQMKFHLSKFNWEEITFDIPNRSYFTDPPIYKSKEKLNNHSIYKMGDLFYFPIK